MTLGRFYQTDQHYLLKIERLHRGRGGGKLAFATVDKNYVRQRRLLIERSFVAAIDCLVDRGKIICTLDRPDNKSAIVCPRRFTVLKYHDSRDIFRPRNIRNIKRLDPLRKVRQLKQFLQFLQYFFRIGFEHSESLLE